MEHKGYNQNVIPLRPQTTEYVNGTAVDLEAMSLQDLLRMEKDCRAHVEEAKTDLMLVRDYLDRRFPGDDGSAA